MITAADLLEIVDALEEAGLWYRLHGGWGIDALVGEQTRDHDDVDLAVARAELDRYREVLAGFEHDPEAWPGLPARCVLRDGQGRQVDLHGLAFDGRGNGWQHLGGDAWGFYPAPELEALGSVGGREVRCASALLQFQHHQAYAWREVERRDLERLAELNGITLPKAPDDRDVCRPVSDTGV